MAVAVEQAVMSPAVRELAQELLPDTPELAAGMTAHLYDTIPELAQGEDDELRGELFASAEANIGQVLWLLRAGEGADTIVIPARSLEFMRSNVRRGIPLPALLRSYRLAHAWLWERWSGALKERVEDSGELAAGQDLSSAFMFAYVDRLSDAVVEEFGNEQQRTTRDVAQLRRETVRAILDGQPIDEHAAASRLSYELRRHHVALRISSRAREVAALDDTVAAAAAALGPGKPLVVPAGAASFDVWWGDFDPPATDALSAFAPPSGVRIAFGRPAQGVVGFRRSHAEALQAARIASLARELAPAVTAYEHIELVSLLTGDLPRARSFVAAQLGPLAASTEPAARLRETVLALLCAAGSATRVAKELHVHHNTVSYRLKRAEEQLGRRVGERPAELICALTLAGVLGEAVLGEEKTSEDEGTRA